MLVAVLAEDLGTAKQQQVDRVARRSERELRGQPRLLNCGKGTRLGSANQTRGAGVGSSVFAFLFKEDVQDPHFLVLLAGGAVDSAPARLFGTSTRGANTPGIGHATMHIQPWGILGAVNL